MEKKSDGYNWGAGIALGVGVGVALGAALDNIAMGLVLGIAMGFAFAAAFANSKDKKKVDTEHIETAPDAGGQEENSLNN